jgi:hypothetical protein
MPIISLPTGKVIHLSVYEWLFKLEEKNVDEFFQSCIADDLGIYEDNPFANRAAHGKLEVEDDPEIEEVPVQESYE